MGVISSSKFNFKETVDGLMRSYNKEVLEVCYETIPKVAKEAVRKLKAESPKESGKYAKGWAAKTERGRLYAVSTVYGKSGTYQIAHLLENGHATRNGTGRVYAPTPAHPHIADVAAWAEDKAYNDIMDKLEGLP